MKIPKLKTPLWQNIVYAVFTLVIPITLIILEVSTTNAPKFQIGFLSILLMLAVFMLSKSFLLDPWVIKQRTNLAAFEHDYETGQGDKELVVTNWKYTQIKLFAFNSVQVVLIGILALMIISAINAQLLKFQGAFMLICTSYILGMAFGISMYLMMGVKKDEEEQDKE